MDRKPGSKNDRELLLESIELFLQNLRGNVYQQDSDRFQTDLAELQKLIAKGFQQQGKSSLRSQAVVPNPELISAKVIELNKSGKATAEAFQTELEALAGLIRENKIAAKEVLAMKAAMVRTAAYCQVAKGNPTQYLASSPLLTAAPAQSSESDPFLNPLFTHAPAQQPRPANPLPTFSAAAKSASPAAELLADNGFKTELGIATRAQSADLTASTPAALENLRDTCDRLIGQINAIYDDSNNSVEDQSALFDIQDNLINFRNTLNTAIYSKELQAPPVQSIDNLDELMASLGFAESSSPPSPPLELPAGFLTQKELEALSLQKLGELRENTLKIITDLDRKIDAAKPKAGETLAEPAQSALAALKLSRHQNVQYIDDVTGIWQQKQIKETTAPSPTSRLSPSAGPGESGQRISAKDIPPAATPRVATGTPAAQSSPVVLTSISSGTSDAPTAAKKKGPGLGERVLGLFKRDKTTDQAAVATDLRTASASASSATPNAVGGTQGEKIRTVDELLKAYKKVDEAISKKLGGFKNTKAEVDEILTKNPNLIDKELAVLAQIATEFNNPANETGRSTDNGAIMQRILAFDSVRFGREFVPAQVAPPVMAVPASLVIPQPAASVVSRPATPISSSSLRSSHDSSESLRSRSSSSSSAPETAGSGSERSVSPAPGINTDPLETKSVGELETMLRDVSQRLLDANDLVMSYSVAENMGGGPSAAIPAEEKAQAHEALAALQTEHANVMRAFIGKGGVIPPRVPGNKSTQDVLNDALALSNLPSITPVAAPASSSGRTAVSQLSQVEKVYQSAIKAPSEDLNGLKIKQQMLNGLKKALDELPEREKAAEVERFAQLNTNVQVALRDVNTAITAQEAASKKAPAPLAALQTVFRREKVDTVESIHKEFLNLDKKFRAALRTATAENQGGIKQQYVANIQALKARLEGATIKGDEALKTRTLLAIDQDTTAYGITPVVSESVENRTYDGMKQRFDKAVEAYLTDVKTTQKDKKVLTPEQLMAHKKIFDDLRVELAQLFPNLSDAKKAEAALFLGDIAKQSDGLGRILFLQQSPRPAVTPISSDTSASAVPASTSASPRTSRDETSRVPSTGPVAATPTTAPAPRTLASERKKLLIIQRALEAIGGELDLVDINKKLRPEDAAAYQQRVSNVAEDLSKIDTTVVNSNPDVKAWHDRLIGNQQRVAALLAAKSPAAIVAAAISATPAAVSPLRTEDSKTQTAKEEKKGFGGLFRALGIGAKKSPPASTSTEVQSASPTTATTTGTGTSSSPVSPAAAGPIAASSNSSDIASQAFNNVYDNYIKAKRAFDAIPADAPNKQQQAQVFNDTLANIELRFKTIQTKLFLHLLPMQQAELPVYLGKIANDRAALAQFGVSQSEHVSDRGTTTSLQTPASGESAPVVSSPVTSAPLPATQPHSGEPGYRKALPPLPAGARPQSPTPATAPVQRESASLVSEDAVSRSSATTVASSVAPASSAPETARQDNLKPVWSAQRLRAAANVANQTKTDSTTQQNQSRAAQNPELTLARIEKALGTISNEIRDHHTNKKKLEQTRIMKLQSSLQTSEILLKEIDRSKLTPDNAQDYDMLKKITAAGKEQLSKISASLVAPQQAAAASSTLPPSPTIPTSPGAVPNAATVALPPPPVVSTARSAALSTAGATPRPATTASDNAKVQWLQKRFDEITKTNPENTEAAWNARKEALEGLQKDFKEMRINMTRLDGNETKFYRGLQQKIPSRLEEANANIAKMQQPPSPS